MSFWYEPVEEPDPILLASSGVVPGLKLFVLFKELPLQWPNITLESPKFATITFVPRNTTSDIVDPLNMVSILGEANISLSNDAVVSIIAFRTSDEK